MRSQRQTASAAQLDGQARLLLAVQALYGVANALSGTFLPVYLWRSGGSFAVIGWFSLSSTAAAGLTFWLAGRWVKAHNKMHSLRTGLFLSCLFYSAVLWLGRGAAGWAVPLGALGGVAAGFFWLAYNVVYFEITDRENRDRFNGSAGFLGSGAGILAPWLSGLLITALKGEDGYRLIFAISLALFGAAGVLSFFLRRRKSEGRYGWLYGFRQLANRDSPWRRAIPALFAQGMREGVFMFLLGLLVFLATGKEKSLGNYTLWTSAVSLGSFWLLGRWLGPGRRRPAMLAGALMIAVVVAPLFWQVNYTTLLLLGIGTGLFMPLYAVPMTSVVFDLIGRSRESAEHREELIVLRELGLTAGRTVGLALYLLVVSLTKRQDALVWLLFAVGAMPVVSWWLLRKRLPGRAGRSRAGGPVRA